MSATTSPDAGANRGTEADASATSGGTASAGQTATVEGETRPNILIIDDDPLLAAIMQRLLAAHYQVTVVSDGRAGLQALAERFYAAVVTDVMMADVSGLALYERLLADDPRQAARLLFVTGGAWAEDCDQQLAATGRPVLEKPFALAALGEAVAAVVRAGEADRVDRRNGDMGRS